MPPRIPKKYTILIARTGRQPITVSFRPLPAILSLLALLGAPLAWIGFTISSLFQSNARLVERNDQLTETANEVLSELSSLDAEIENLRERAGLSGDRRGPQQSEAAVPQGGAAMQVEPEELFRMAKWRMPMLISTLDRNVKPALEETLAEEAAREAAYPNKRPLKGAIEISSEFGLRLNPFGGRGYEMHEGIDFKGAYGAPVFATAEGAVKQAEYSGGYGYHVVINHGYGYETLYAHLSDMEVVVGDRISQGQLIGYLGSTGRSSGPHLHYGIYRQGIPVNPEPYLGLEKSSQAIDAANNDSDKVRRRL